MAGWRTAADESVYVHKHGRAEDVAYGCRCQQEASRTHLFLVMTSQQHLCIYAYTTRVCRWLHGYRSG